MFVFSVDLWLLISGLDNYLQLKLIVLNEMQKIKKYNTGHCFGFFIVFSLPVSGCVVIAVLEGAREENVILSCGAQWRSGAGTELATERTRVKILRSFVTPWASSFTLRCSSSRSCNEYLTVECIQSWMSRVQTVTVY